MDDRADEGPYVGAGRAVLPLLRAGFSFDDVGRLAAAEDVRTLASVLEEVRKQGKVERLLSKLDFAEAMNAAFVGSQPGRQNQVAYGRWLRSVEREVAKLQGQKLSTLWDTMRRSKRLRHK